MGKKKAKRKLVLKIGSSVECTGVGYVGNAPHSFDATPGTVIDIADDVSVNVGTHGTVTFRKSQLKVVK